MAACVAEADSPVAEEAGRQLDPSCKLPASGDEPPQLVVGTLDLNIGELRAELGSFCLQSMHVAVDTLAVMPRQCQHPRFGACRFVSRAAQG